MYVFFLEINECESDPCLSSGTCVDELNQYTCNCVPGYTGINCETGKNTLHSYDIITVSNWHVASVYRISIHKPTHYLL